jgi:hypothetical protein
MGGRMEVQAWGDFVGTPPTEILAQSISLIWPHENGD